MKLSLLTTLLPLTTLALPNPNPNPNPHQTDHTTASSFPPNTTTPLDPRAITAITMHLGTRKTNMGGTSYNMLYNNVYNAIRTACPFDSFATTCHNVFSTFKVRTHAAPGVAPFQVDVKVIIDGARWYANRAVYNLMVGAIAGAVERGTYLPRNCQSFRQSEGGVMRSYTYCNTVDRASIALPGVLRHYMDVSLETVAGTGEFSCEGVTSTVESYLDTLKPEFQTALGIPEMYVQATCVYD
ncbi:hypothetical protein T440DRAFT_488592 [Plenodomus tracheiphilus IPT5]|uniref:Uncharacterized protein n=1 Tax=Plenodomus tracheiphilus IPT5 TaxID=1408161 RepID=A0A6A7B9B3_9PLEO|nr:hypothetical protein T440DRAFT_488592 [Plenodomus tracheiphilus IPT5]